MIAIIDYGMGNLHSVYHKLRCLGASVSVVGKPEDIGGADGIILPGVGHFRAGMNVLAETGLAQAIREQAAAGVPILGICLGCQLLCDHSEEGDTQGLGLIKGRVGLFPPDTMNGLKVPHMGWNTVDATRPDPLLDGVTPDDFFYFVHSYRLCDVEETAVLGTTRYGHPFPSVIRQANVMGTQFHPEKSHDNGKNILNNFMELCRCSDPV